MKNCLSLRDAEGGGQGDEACKYYRNKSYSTAKHICMGARLVNVSHMYVV